MVARCPDTKVRSNRADHVGLTSGNGPKPTLKDDLVTNTWNQVSGSGATTLPAGLTRTATTAANTSVLRMVLGITWWRNSHPAGGTPTLPLAVEMLVTGKAGTGPLRQLRHFYLRCRRNTEIYVPSGSAVTYWYQDEEFYIDSADADFVTAIGGPGQGAVTLTWTLTCIRYIGGYPSDSMPYSYVWRWLEHT